MPRPIELLSPARNLECGIEAIRHGADAVYIGAPRFGARAAAGNSVEDIARLVEFAHPFGVRIYVTLNTLLRADEFTAAQTLINELAAIHVDALIVQDTHISPLASHRPEAPLTSPLPLHSSTQMDNRTAEDVRARLDAGYQQTVLARELSLDEIRAIHTAVPEMPLEVFIHGALCVSYSGCCYASEYCFNRSANRGECAQFCRLPFDLVDAEGKTVTLPSSSAEGHPLRQRHLLSLRDMNRSADLEALMDAGVSSFKIEGRLKDVSYVKNITAYYRQCIDAIINRRPTDFCHASRGLSTISFTPNPLKSFNRGFTDYFLHTGTSAATPASAPLHQHLTPKSLGEPIGTIKEVFAGNMHRGLSATSPSFTVSGTVPINNGDGLCFFTSDNHLQGFRINRADEQGRLYPSNPAILNLLRRGTRLFRNLDAAFERQLSRSTADRRIHICWQLEDNVSFSTPEEPSSPATTVSQTTAEGFYLTISEVTPFPPEAHPLSVTRFFALPLEPARTPQTDNLRRQLLRLGDTPFSATEADVTLHLSDNWFIPASTLADWRREIIRQLIDLLKSSSHRASPIQQPSMPDTGPSLPVRSHREVLMTCRYCLRQALGFCTKAPDSYQHFPKDPLFLRLADGRRFRLRFDCKNCLMYVLPFQHVNTATPLTR